VLVLYPNKTGMREKTDTLGRARFGFHSELPIIVFCAAPGYRAHIVRNWLPPAPLSVSMVPLPNGGSMVMPESTDHIHGLTGRLNPILDHWDRMYLYATNIAINHGQQQPVRFKLNEPLRLTDVHGVEMIVRFMDMLGNSSVLEYEPVTRSSR